ncbi:MAG TPA: hypothetical protein VHF70_02040 [Rubrobacteraceae bacterium]|nr:hypothetical protein [Rubrobacteraceae bacterium]
MTVSEKTQRLAWVVLRTADRTQARGSSVRLVAPRAPEVAGELEPLLGEAELLRAEEYLLERGYVAPANLGLTWGTYTITPAGFHWLEGGLLEEPLPTQERLRELANRPGEEEEALRLRAQSAAAGGNSGDRGLFLRSTPILFAALALICFAGSVFSGTGTLVLVALGAVFVITAFYAWMIL